MKILIKTKKHIRDFSSPYFARKYKDYLNARRTLYKQYVLKDDGIDVGIRGIEGVRMSSQLLREVQA